MLLKKGLDFYCPVFKLAIECDGSQHYSPKGLLADQIRDQALSALDIKILRFDNRQILLETDAVCQVIADMVQERMGESAVCKVFKSPFEKGRLGGI